MPDSPNSHDRRARPAGANELQILIFTLGEDPRSGRSELFGIDVFQVREVMRRQAITRSPHAPAAVAGMTRLRDALLPVIDLAQCAGLASLTSAGIMIVAEASGRTQAFLVQSVESILRCERAALEAPPAMLSGAAPGLVSAVTACGDGRLIMMLDLERVLAGVAGSRPQRAPQGRARFGALQALEP